MFVRCFLLGHFCLEVERSGTGRRQWRRRGFRGRWSIAAAAVGASFNGTGLLFRQLPIKKAIFIVPGQQHGSVPGVLARNRM
jgi:hypothetical protein